MSFESLFFMMALVSLPFLVVVFARLGHRSKHALNAVVRGRWNARIRSGVFFRGDRILIEVDEVHGEITYGEFSGRGTSPSLSGWTRVRFDWPSERRLRIAPEGIATRLRRLFGGADLRFDDPAFDDRFWVESSHPSWARSLLATSVRGALLKLRLTPVCPDPHDVMLDLGPSGLSLRISALLLDNADALGSFVELAIAVLQKARGLVEAAGMSVEAVRARAGSSCPICGHPVGDQALACPSCRTPHHRDCWAYFGGCALFGCRTRARKVA